MKKNVLSLFLLLSTVISYSQTTANNISMKTDLPTILPPSPTVAGLMKFEEVPVSNYTGVPDISIPLFSETGNHDLKFNMSLNYSTVCIKKDEVAGYTGLGWSLFAGGTISRTVRDIPDEAFININIDSKKIGIFHNDGTLDYDNNNYYDVIPLLNSNYDFDYSDQGINRFLFEVNEKQKFDAKHDLFQFNFMGYTGRFIIEKKPNGSFEILKLDKNNLAISCDANNKIFEIKDTKGFKYVFDVKELISSDFFSYAKDINYDEINLNGGNVYNDIISAYHLSKVFYNDELVLEFIFKDGYVIESQTVGNLTRNIPILPSLAFIQGAAHSEISSNPQAITLGVLPLEVLNSNTIKVKTKKIKQIRLVGKAIIDMELGTGRADTNVNHPELASYLTKIKIRDWSVDTTNIVKQYELKYLFGNKLFLKEIKEGIVGNQISKCQFKYKDFDLAPTDYDSDYWGYYKLMATNCDILMQRNREADHYCSKDVLKQIIYPTKGSSVFEFEPNTYSYIGDFPIPEDLNQNDYFEDFNDNPDNWGTIEPFSNTSILDNNFSLSSRNDIEDLKSLGYFTVNKHLFFTSVIANNEALAGFLRLIKKDNSTPPHYTTVTALGGERGNVHRI